MNLKSTRIILSVIMAFLIALSCCLASFCVIVNQTVANKNFYQSKLSNNELVDLCNEQLESKYAALSKKSNIPFEVYNGVMNAYDTKESMRQAAEYLFDENDASLFNENKINFFYSSITEYLDVNEVPYDKNDVMNASVEAAKIYSDTVGLHGLDGIQDYVVTTNKRHVRLLSVCVLLVFIFCILIIYLYKEKEKAIFYIGAGVIGAGVADCISAGVLMLAKIGEKYVVYPFAYVQVLQSMTKNVYAYGLLAGVVLILVGWIVFAIGLKRQKTVQERKDTRFVKIIGKM